MNGEHKLKEILEMKFRRRHGYFDVPDVEKGKTKRKIESAKDRVELQKQIKEVWDE